MVIRAANHSLFESIPMPASTETSVLRPSTMCERFQRRWVAWVITTNSSGAKYVRMATMLAQAGIIPRPVIARSESLHAASDNPADQQQQQRQHALTLARRSLNKAFRRAWVAIEADATTGEAEFSLVLEDDVAVSPALRPSHVIRMLSCAAWLSSMERQPLPLLYAGICEPQLTSDIAISQIDFGGPDWGHLAASGLTLLHTPTATFARAVGLCGHAYAIRRGAAARMRAVVDSVSGIAGATDRQLKILVARMGGVYVAGLNLRSPLCFLERPPPIHVGVFYQDRLTFPSPHWETLGVNASCTRERTHWQSSSPPHS